MHASPRARTRFPGALLAWDGGACIVVISHGRHAARLRRYRRPRRLSSTRGRRREDGARTPDERARAPRLTACVLVQASALTVARTYVGPVRMPITSPCARNPSWRAWQRELSGSAREGAECRRGLMVSRGMEVLTAVGDVMVSMVLGTVPLAAPNARIRPRGHYLKFSAVRRRLSECSCSRVFVALGRQFRPTD